MAIHESGVNYRNLIRDLADLYPFDVDEVVLVELIANSLDAKPTRIEIEFDTHKRTLVVTDNGKGMTDSDFDQYHDFAAGLKTRGTGIGFAGVGAKISFNIAERVITETKSESFARGSDWYLKTDSRLEWEDIQPKHLHKHGTRVEVNFLQNATLANFSTESLIKLIKRHYLPLLDMKYLDLYERLGYYSSDLRFVINGKVITPVKLIEDFALEKVREFFPQKAGKGIGYGIFGLASSEYPLGADICGVLLCTLGKVIKADLFNQFPGSIGSRILGVVEIPGFAEFLTTAKTDFIRRSNHRKFEGLYNPVRQEFKSWLGEIGIQSPEISDTDEAKKLEKELKKLLEDIPELSDFFELQTRKTTLQQDTNGTINTTPQEGIKDIFLIDKGKKGEEPGVDGPGMHPGQTLKEDKKTGTKPAKPIGGVGSRGPKITFIDVPEREDLAWVEGNNVFINIGHPSYAKVRSNATAKMLHNLFSIASAVQKLIANEGEGNELMFIDKMMASWGRKK